MMLAIVFVTGLAGAAYSWLSGVGVDTLWVWGAFSVAAALLVAVAYEIERGTIADITSAERVGRRRVSSAAPSVAARMLRGLAPDMRTLLGYAIYRPESDYAMSVRHALTAIGASQVVAVVAATPRTGATATAASIAAIASQQSKRVLLVDCDLRQRGSTRLLEVEPEAGVLEATGDPRLWPSLIQEEPETGLHLMPAARLANPWGRLFGQPGLPQLLEQWRQHYDLILLDCPPALTNADGAMLTRMADLSMIVIAWDETPATHIRQMMRRFRHNAPQAITLHINRAPSDLLDQVRINPA